jgi:hypothetical protein
LSTDVSEVRAASIIRAMMEAARTSETSFNNYFTRQYIPEDTSELHTRRRENLKSHMCFKAFVSLCSQDHTDHAPCIVYLSVGFAGDCLRPGLLFCARRQSVRTSCSEPRLPMSSSTRNRGVRRMFPVSTVLFALSVSRAQGVYSTQTRRWSPQGMRGMW